MERKDREIYAERVLRVKTCITLDAMETYVREWNNERRRRGFLQFYCIKCFDNGHWEVRETRQST